VSDDRTQTVFWYIEVFKSATNKNAGSVYRRAKRFFAINQKHGVAGFGEESGAVKTRKSGADNDYVIVFHWIEVENLVAW
jgi:hypothetical protein